MSSKISLLGSGTRSFSKGVNYRKGGPEEKEDSSGVFPPITSPCYAPSAFNPSPFHDSIAERPDFPLYQQEAIRWLQHFKNTELLQQLLACFEFSAERNYRLQELLGELAEAESGNPICLGTNSTPRTWDCGCSARRLRARVHPPQAGRAPVEYDPHRLGIGPGAQPPLPQNEVAGNLLSRAVVARTRNQASGERGQFSRSAASPPM